jgi:hypothetical protein
MLLVVIRSAIDGTLRVMRAIPVPVRLSRRRAGSLKAAVNSGWLTLLPDVSIRVGHSESYDPSHNGAWMR